MNAEYKQGFCNKKKHMHQIDEVFNSTHVTGTHDMDARKHGLLLKEIKSIVAKELIVYTVRLENMGIPFQGDDISLEAIEKASKPTMGRMKEVDVKIEPSETTELVPVYNNNSKLELNSSLLQSRQQNLFRDLCTPLSVHLTDYRKYPVLSTKEMIRWRNTYESRLQKIEGDLDHVVLIVHQYLNLTETFYMSANGVLQKINVTENVSVMKQKIFEIKVCCWYSRNKRIRELYLQLEQNIHVDEIEIKVHQGLSRYLPHYIMLCGNHVSKCPNECRCCETCKTDIWFQNIQSSEGKQNVQGKQVNAGNKSLIAKALAFTKGNGENTNQNITRKEQPNGAIKNELLEIQHVTKNNVGLLKCNTINKLQIIEIDHKGQIQTYIEKQNPDFERFDLVDERMKKTVIEICCWKKLQITIELLKEKNIQPEIHRFIQQRHTCLINSCQCCCSWPPGNTMNFQFHPKTQKILQSTEPKDKTPKSNITVKSMNYLTEQQKPIKKPPTKSRKRKLKTQKIPASTFSSDIPVYSPTASVTAALPDQHTIRVDNSLDVKTIFIPPGTPVSGYKVDTKLMKSIIDQEITRLIRETPMPSNEQINTIYQNSNTPLVLSETRPNEVPPVSEVNDHINQIIEKFKDIRLSVTREGKVKAIISHPPETPGDLTLLKNILQKIQALLDEHTEKSDKTLSNILGPQRSHLVSGPLSAAPAPLFVTHLNIPSTIQGITPNTNPTPVTYYFTKQRPPTLCNATIAQHPGTYGQTSNTLVDLLERAPIPPNFPTTMSTEQGGLMNIRIEKVESLGEKSMNSPSQKDKIHNLAQTKSTPYTTTSTTIISSTSTSPHIDVQATLGPSVIKPLPIPSSAMTIVPKTFSAVTCQSTLSPSSSGAFHLRPLFSIGQSASMPLVPVQYSSMHSMSLPRVSSSCSVPVDFTTVNAPAVLIAQNDDGMETETILGE